ncbi:YdcF family protein [Ferrovibrio xuzhouensis]|uniref:YdcF family protein n=1 Tax=Ferrovibrio xuzhouensis TaxID=1576914 RepID=A0ABV7VDK7_9PROT
MAKTTAAPPGRRLKRWLAALAALALLWLGGALVYIDQIEHLPQPGDQRTDAIVVLTGGTARLATALRLLNEQKAERLLVSGVGPTVTKASLLQAVLPSMPDAAQAAANWQGIDLQLLFECCVDLGFEAADTAGNALETAGWLNAHGYKSIRLVTANYHMPRSLVEFSRRLPGITIVPHPVLPDSMRVEGWWQRRQAAGFLLGEYSKYAIALIRARLDAAIAAALGETGAAAPAQPAAPPQPQPQPGKASAS